MSLLDHIRRARGSAEPRALLVKLAHEIDFYIAWSESTESPEWYGTRVEAGERGYSEERIDRADRTGSSSYPGFCRWNHATLIAEQRGVLPRRYLRAYTLLYDAGEMQAAFDLLDPFDDETPVRRVELPARR